MKLARLYHNYLACYEMLKKMTKSKGNGESKPKEKEALKSEGGISKEGKCFHCDKPGHLKKKLPILS
ncbi:hypothetical protein GQ457_09G017310 [Hibiscus cannabinus]